MALSKRGFTDTAGALLCAALAIWMLMFLFQTAVNVRNQYVGFPVEDYWRTAANLPKYERFDLRVLWEQHNEHRVVVPELIYAADDLLFGAHEYLPIILSALFQAATFGILAWTIWRDLNLSPTLRLAAILIGGIVLGWPGIAYGLSFPFLIQWTIIQVLVLSALVMLTRGKLIAPLICAVLATYSGGHGMLLWPVMLLAGFILGIGRKRLGIIALCAALSLVIYFQGLIPTNEVQSRQFLSEPTWFIGFLSSMLSMPFAADRRIFGLWLGPASFVLFLAMFASAVRHRLLRETPAIILFGMSIFSLLTVLVCGIGRTLPTYWDYPTAKVARYVNVPVCYWAILLVITIWVLARTCSTARFAWASVAIFAAALAYQFPKVDSWLDRQFDFFSRAQSATLALESGVLCDNINQRDMYPDPSRIPEWNSILKYRRLSIYSRDRFQWVGRPVASYLSVKPEGGSKGAVTETLHFACGYQLAGWLQGNERELLLVNEKGIIAGLARRLPAGLPLYLPKVWARATPSENWTGFVNPAIASETIRPYVVLSDGRSAVPIGVPSSPGK